MYIYKINDANAVEIYVDEQETPTITQPYYPNGDAFGSRSEAETWAQLFIASMEDETAPYAPHGRRMPGAPKFTKERRLNGLKTRAAELGEDAPEDLLQQIATLEEELAEDSSNKQ